jgi:hypothetical protein
MKNGVFWDVTPCGSCKNRRFGGLSASFIRVTRIGELETTLAVTSNRKGIRSTFSHTYSGIPHSEYIKNKILGSTMPYIQFSLCRNVSLEEWRLLGYYTVWLFLTRATWRNIAEVTILHSHCHENSNLTMVSLVFCHKLFLSLARYWRVELLNMALVLVSFLWEHILHFSGLQGCREHQFRYFISKLIIWFWKSLVMGDLN